jgi:hypothetical protein
MANYPFKNWYAIVDGGCWYVGYHIDREAAHEQAIKQFNVQLSKAGFCIVDRDTLELIYDTIKICLERDSK